MGFMKSIIQTEVQPALSVKKVTSMDDLPHVIEAAFRAIVDYLSQCGRQPLGPAYIAYFNMEPEKMEIEIGFPVEEVIEGEGQISTSEIPAGKKANCFYRGAYSGLNSAYEDLAEWVVEKGYETTGVVYEFYYNAPQYVPENELLTEISFLLK